MPKERQLQLRVIHLLAFLAEDAPHQCIHFLTQQFIFARQLFHHFLKQRVVLQEQRVLFSRRRQFSPQAGNEGFGGVCSGCCVGLDHVLFMP